ncbi:MAG: hypothetical protein MUC49_06180 [Raineya sp.]|jgi:hypothetical protein|nr:hypothetical protein [Raineya sp.]
MKNMIVILCLLLAYQAQSQTLKIAHKSHSGNMKHFVVSKTAHTLGLPSNYAEKKEAERKKKDSIKKAEEKIKQDSIKKAKKNTLKKKGNAIKEDTKTQKSSLNYQKATKRDIYHTTSLAYPVVHQNTNQGNSKNWIVMLMSILPTFLVLFLVLQKIKWL